MRFNANAGLVMTQILVLPWPPSELNPNRKRGHWAKSHSIAKAYKDDCRWSCKEQGIKAISAERVHVTYYFYPPDRRPRDLDNIIASLKSAQDAVAAHIGVDDAKWQVTYKPLGQPAKCGSVVLQIKPIEVMA